jgi:23S rRNA (cytidine2498-2'-O)-methyltransferase
VPRFLFVTCQIGAEKAIKAEMARQWPKWPSAFSRPGLLTFKLDDPAEHLPGDFDLHSVFARAYGFSLGQVKGGDERQLAAAVWQLLGDRPFQRIHVWQRDEAPAGEHGYEPGITSAAQAAYEAIREACPRSDKLSPAHDFRRPARPGDWVLDCVLVDPGLWLVGYHRAASVPSRWPGGMMPLTLPDDAVSRAWLKMEEALAWSHLPARRGARWAEIGSAPGGSSQALLGHGFDVLGIDPAEMDPTILSHPHFEYLRRRATEVPRRSLRKVRWLAADMNVAPNYTLDFVGAIISHAEVNVRGLLLTLKLLQWDLAAQVPAYIERVRGWGYNIVRARQLAHNRREFCLAALQTPFRRKRPGTIE